MPYKIIFIMFITNSENFVYYLEMFVIYNLLTRNIAITLRYECVCIIYFVFSIQILNENLIGIYLYTYIIVQYTQCVKVFFRLDI